MARLVSHPEFNNKKKQTGGVKAIARIPENNKLCLNVAKLEIILR